ncbi:uncharacterized protein LOC131220032 [Magnolia sinica]|uniref:uncharacterized protein LOC131220032 n=1 Tax=Magnolia sinica TaxID=86752 RepID=UPI00265A4560|nr:uncharacterized protein LOC131220032 [Magnolia sinica]
MALAKIISGLKKGKFLFSIGKNPSTTMGDFMNRAQKYSNVEDFFSSRKGTHHAGNSSGDKKRKDAPFQPSTSKKRSDEDRFHSQRLSRKSKSRFSLYTPLNTSLEQILLDIRDKKLLHWPSCMKTEAEIVTLIRKGHLCQCIKEEKQAQKDEQLTRVTNDVTEIWTIYEGPSGGGDSNQSRKAHARSIDPKHYIHLADRSSKELRMSPCSLTFTEDDAHEIQHPHDDALVVNMTIANCKVYRILVDMGSSANILYFEAFDKMGIDRSRLQPVRTSLHGFAGDKIILEGTISRPVIAGEGQNQVTLLVDFLVVNTPSTYNVILGRPSLNSMRAVVSTYHLIMKFPAVGGIDYLLGD